MVHYVVMKSSSVNRRWATFRFYLLAIGILSTFVSPAQASGRWNSVLLGYLGFTAAYAIISTFLVVSPRRSTILPSLTMVDICVMSVLMLVLGRVDQTCVLVLYGLVSLASLCTNTVIGSSGAAIAALFYVVTLLRVGNIAGPAALTPHVFPLMLFFIFGIAGGSLRTVILGGATNKFADSHSSAIDDVQRKSRDLFRQKEEREKQLVDKQQQLNTLISISHKMSSTRNSKELLQVMCTKAREGMNCSAAFVMLLDREQLQLVQSVGISEITRRLMDCKCGEGLLGEVVATGQAVRLSEKDADPRLLAFKQNWEGFRNILVVPLSTSQELIEIGARKIPKPFGILGVGNILVGDAFDDSQEDYLRILATSASISLKNIVLTEELEQSYHEIIHALAQAIEAKDPYTHGHIGRVQEYAINLARALRLSETEVKVIAKGAILHDVGKISTPNEILNKKGALTPAERKKMDDHVTSSIHILKDIKSLPAEVFEMVLYHHERYDGKGYPYGLKAEEIPIGAQVISIVDAFDAMTTDRPYRKGFSQDRALELLANSAGTQFSPKVLQAFLGLFNYKPKSATGAGISTRELTQSPK